MNCTEYFSVEQWDLFQKRMAIAKETCGQLARKYKLRQYEDCRWPAIGFYIRRWFRRRYLKIILNPKYLADNREFYELRDHVVISFSIFYTRIVYDSVLNTYTIDEMADGNRLRMDVEAVLSAQHRFS